MLPESVKLRLFDYNRLKLRQTYHVSAFFNIRKKDAGADGDNKFIVFIPKKTEKKAVRRNRTKRVIHSWIMDNLNRINPGWYIIKVVKPVPSQEKRTVLKELDSLISK